MTKKLETVTNIAILIVAVLAGAVLVKNYLLPRAPRKMPEQIPVGTKLSVPGVDWQANGNTLVLVLTTGCEYCSESAPFYRRLAAELPRQRVHMTAVLPQTVEEGREYLRKLEVDVSDVRQSSLEVLKIHATPTLVLADEQGVVLNVWLGQLSADKQQQVIETVLGASELNKTIDRD